MEHKRLVHLLKWNHGKRTVKENEMKKIRIDQAVNGFLVQDLNGRLSVREPMTVCSTVEQLHAHLRKFFPLENTSTDGEKIDD